MERLTRRAKLCMGRSVLRFAARLSQASASLMTDMLKGRTVVEAEKLMGGFLHLVKGDAPINLNEDDRERLNVMAGVSAFPMRVKCATLAWHTMKSALEGGSPAKTE